MRRLFLILSLAAIILQSFSKGIILLSFEMNKDFIAKNFCIQKEVENNCCKGSCQLKKQLAEDDQKSESIPFQNLKDKLDLLLFCETVFDYRFDPFQNERTSCWEVPASLVSSESSILHPPPRA